MLASPIPPSHLEKYRLSTTSLGCNAFCIVSLVFSGLLEEWSRVSYQGDSPGIYPFDKVPAIEFRLKQVLALLRYSFYIFYFIFCYLMVSVSNIPEYLLVSFSLSVLITLFGSSTVSVMCRLALFITSMMHCFIPNSIPISWLFILRVCIRVSNSLSFLADTLMSSIYIKWIIFSCDLLNLYPAVHFLRIWLSGMMAITKSNGESASPWNMPLWIFTSAKLCPPAVNSSL